VEQFYWPDEGHLEFIDRTVDQIIAETDMTGPGLFIFKEIMAFFYVKQMGLLVCDIVPSIIDLEILRVQQGAAEVSNKVIRGKLRAPLVDSHASSFVDVREDLQFRVFAQHPYLLEREGTKEALSLYSQANSPQLTRVLTKISSVDIFLRLNQEVFEKQVAKVGAHLLAHNQSSPEYEEVLQLREEMIN